MLSLRTQCPAYPRILSHDSAWAFVKSSDCSTCWVIVEVIWTPRSKTPQQTLNMLRACTVDKSSAFARSLKSPQPMFLGWSIRSNQFSIIFLTRRRWTASPQYENQREKNSSKIIGSAIDTYPGFESVHKQRLAYTQLRLNTTSAESFLSRRIVEGSVGRVAKNSTITGKRINELTSFRSKWLLLSSKWANEQLNIHFLRSEKLPRAYPLVLKRIKLSDMTPLRELWLKLLNTSSACKCAFLIELIFCLLR